MQGGLGITAYKPYGAGRKVSFGSPTAIPTQNSHQSMTFLDLENVISSVLRRQSVSTKLMCIPFIKTKPKLLTSSFGSDVAYIVGFVYCISG